MPQFRFYGDKGEISGKMNISSSETTLKELFISQAESMNVYKTMSEQDICNIFLTYIQKVSGHYGNQRILELGGDVFQGNYLMCWYVYDITVPAGGTVENSVTAPLWPGIALNYNPHKYEYSYLLSPAQQWAGFGEIEININTPYHILEINQENFIKNESGYTYNGSGLPEGELTFTLCAVDKPEKADNSAYTRLFALPVLFITGLIVFFLVLIRNIDRKNEEKQRKEKQ